VSENLPPQPKNPIRLIREGFESLMAHLDKNEVLAAIEEVDLLIIRLHHLRDRPSRRRWVDSGSGPGWAPPPDYGTAWERHDDPEEEP
jgi:hypothetical protein